VGGGGQKFLASINRTRQGKYYDIAPTMMQLRSFTTNLVKDKLNLQQAERCFD
jgi:hypothetical protein